jgi:DNA polymerase III sliding clamp (beta) subunit (PCNA family)
MLRMELLEKLRLVAPALSDKELIPVLTHFWFQGNTVMAFNDQIAIQTRLKTDFTGAVPGKVLLELLGASRSTEVKFTLTDDNLLVALGHHSKKTGKFVVNTKIDLKVLPVEDFIHTMPPVKPDAGIKGTQEFLPAIECCMQSISNDTSIPDQLGLTLIPNGKDLYLYATNNQTLSHAKVKAKTDLPGRVILSKPFCEQLIALTQDRDFRLIVATDHAMVVVPDHATLFGRLVSSEHPLDFNEIMEAHLPDGKGLQMITLPDNLEYVLKRALVITDTKMEETKSLITVKDGRMTVISKSPLGELKDNVAENKKKYDENNKLIEQTPIKDHPDISVRLNPRLLKAGYGRYDKLLVTESCAVMVKDDTVYLVSATN